MGTSEDDTTGGVISNLSPGVVLESELGLLASRRRSKESYASVIADRIWGEGVALDVRMRLCRWEA